MVRNPGRLTRGIVWAKDVPPFLKEDRQRHDDNHNGIIDETGLSFVKICKSITSTDREEDDPGRTRIRKSSGHGHLQEPVA